MHDCTKSKNEMSLKVTVKSATKLPNLKDESGSLDPYVSVKFRGVKKSTEKLEDTLTPQWDQSLEWSLKSPMNPNEEILFKIYDRMALNRRREIGTLNYNVSELLDQSLKKEGLKLKPSHKDIDKSDWEKFRLNVEFHYQSKSVVTKPSNVPLDYQVYVYLFKGRRLDGDHINPLVTVTCDKQSKTTISKIDTNNPVYNEMKTFYYKSTESELLTKEIQISVRDDSTARKAAIGHFTIDIGSVYEEQDHTLYNKWLVLCDPNDSMAPATGFLQVSISIRGPNDEPVYLSTSNSDDENLDFGSNLLRSTGVTMQQATLVTRFYHAKDIPAVDPSTIKDAIKKIFTHKESTQSADPYIVVTFDGHSEQTSVKSNDQNPEWNEQINIGFQYPSVCDKIVLQIKDKDRFFSADDYIGTDHINIPEIAVHGPNGYLPTFGPCYLNIYGSPQSGFSIFPDKYDAMNRGKLEGVAYRGRILLEIDTQLGDAPKKKFQPIKGETQQTLDRFVGKVSDYSLCVLFNGASLIDNDNNHIGFEVSIGNYSRTIDVDRDIVIKDGPSYFTVAWDNMKPLIELNCKWEDCSYRADTLNIIDHHFKRMEEFVSEIKANMTKEEMNELNDQIQYILRSCHNLLENLAVNKSCTKLDKNLREHRLNELSDMIITADTVCKKSDQHNERLTALLDRFKALTIDPQYSIPDVIVWLLNNKTRVGYCRIRTHTILFSEGSWTGGRLSGKLQALHLKTPRISNVKPSKANHCGVVEMALSLGLSERKDVLLQDMSEGLYSNITNRDHKNQRLILDKNASVYELRAYLLQARGLYSGDSSGLSDPYCIVSFSGITSVSKTVTSSITPKWYQTIALKNIRQFVKPEVIEKSPFTVDIQIFDKDRFGDDDYLGTVEAKPVVRMTQDAAIASLGWYSVRHLDSNVGQLLAAFELIRVDNHGFVPEPLEEDKIPDRLVPPTIPKVVKVQCLGVRNMTDYRFIPIKHPYVAVQCDQQTHSTGFIRQSQSMLPDRNISMKLELPVDELFSPPLNIFVYDKRFGYSPLIGSHSVITFKQFEQAIDGKQLTKLCNPVVDPEVKIQGTITRKDSFDWWSKYYASIGNDSLVQEGYPNGAEHTLTVYPRELEESFNHFTDDIVKTYPLYTGKGDHHTSSPVGYFKGIISVDEPGTAGVSTDEDGLPMIYPQHVLVRVYVIKGLNLKPLDILKGKSDPYIEVTLGDHKVSNVDDYIPNTTDPIFGQVLEINAVLPDNDELTVTIKDHDYLTRDDTIGLTRINLEDRFLSLHRASIGIPRSFSTRGLNSWRDYMTPVDILNIMCSMKGHNIDWSDDRETVTINNHHYHLTDFETSVTDDGNNQQRLALHVLQQYNLVPEHIETRTLYKDDEPNMPQGQLHMWVDIIPKTTESRVLPPVININPRKPVKYVFRTVVWSVADVTLPDNQKTSDFYVTSILNSADTQKTDVHYFAFGGEGQFNWRFVYPFDYDPIAKKIVFKQKEHFYSIDRTQQSVDDKIVFQVWDKDFFSSNEFLGQVEFCLHNAPQPATSKSQCSLETLNQRVDFFKTKINYTAKGWLPIYKGQGEERQCTGKLNVWLEMLTEDEANSRPAGQGRDEPNQYPELHKPDRPLLKFSFFESALKTFKFSIWKNHKCLVLFGVLCLTILVFSLLII